MPFSPQIEQAARQNAFQKIHIVLKREC